MVMKVRNLSTLFFRVERLSGFLFNCIISSGTYFSIILFDVQLSIHIHMVFIYRRVNHVDRFLTFLQVLLQIFSNKIELLLIATIYNLSFSGEHLYNTDQPPLYVGQFTWTDETKIHVIVTKTKIHVNPNFNLDIKISLGFYSVHHRSQ